MIPLADLARAMFAAAVAAVQPETLLRRLELTPSGIAFGDDRLEPAGRLVLVALGKAGPGLAAAFLARARRPPDLVLVVAPDASVVPPPVAAWTRLASHPVPDERGRKASRELLGVLAGLTPADGVVLLLSGGASAVLAQPLAGLSAADVGALTSDLLGRGATIGELNTVRKHLLAAAGGRLAAGCAAPVLTFVLSDVPGDALATIASGPTVGDPSTCADALDVLARHALATRHARISAFLAAEPGRTAAESPKPGDPRLAHARAHLLGDSSLALAAAADVARQAGLAPIQLTRTLRGEAREVGTTLGALASAAGSGEGAALLLGGETTVTVRGDGCGGRNLELALAAAAVLRSVPERCLLAAGTDGVDGTSPAAGAIVDGATLSRAVARGRDAAAALERNNAWGFFAGMPEAIVTGPTGTNVADLVFVLVAGAVPAFVGDRPADAASLAASSDLMQP